MPDMKPIKLWGTNPMGKTLHCLRHSLIILPVRPSFRAQPVQGSETVLVHCCSATDALQVLIILCELGIPYEIKPVRFDEVKKEPFVSLNPNGRMPAIEDPNTDIVLWESGAIIEYLVETYDTDHKLSYVDSPEKWQQGSWKHFQMSGQGPYFGQLTWFGKVLQTLPSLKFLFDANIGAVPPREATVSHLPLRERDGSHHVRH